MTTTPLRAKCWRCKRTRYTKFLVGRVQASGRTAWQCRARSFCASLDRRNKEKRERARNAQ